MRETITVDAGGDTLEFEIEIETRREAIEVMEKTVVASTGMDEYEVELLPLPLLLRLFTETSEQATSNFVGVKS